MKREEARADRGEYRQAAGAVDRKCLGLALSLSLPLVPPVSVCFDRCFGRKFFDLNVVSVVSVKTESQRLPKIETNTTTYIFGEMGRSLHWLKGKNAKAPAVTRETEEDWG